VHHLPTDRPQAGFTLIEALVALAIAAISLVAIGQLMSTNFRGVGMLENHVALVQTAQTVLATEVPPRGALVPGTLTGRSGNARWQIDIGPVGGDWIVDKADVNWIPELVKVQVRGPAGGSITLETVRLMRRPSQ
jgi:general secretion pathway protein I